MEEKKVLQQINDIVGDNVQKLAKVFPGVVKDGEVDFEALREELGQFREVSSEKYELTWAGKKNAKKLAQEDVVGRTLKYYPEESVDPENTENLYIEGDNLEVLKLLRQNYYGAIKMIYIDPPYNTGNDFIYNDDFSVSADENFISEGDMGADGERYSANLKTSNRFHSKWLSMIFSRLIVAKDLMSPDGVIFMSIDENELDNLWKVCNEVFGEENFVALLSVEINPKGRKNSKFISVSNDYCLVFAKNISEAYFVENVPKNIKDLSQDEDGNFVHNSGKRVLVGENSFNNRVSNVNSPKNYTVYYHPQTKAIEIVKESKPENINQELISKGFERYVSVYKDQLIENTYTEDKFLELFAEKKLDFKNGKIYEKNMSTTIRLKSMLVNRDYEGVINGVASNVSLDYKTTSAGTALKTLFNSEDVYFTAPKNIGLIKVLETLIDGDEFTILDFFSGSATTAEAVMSQNAIDGKHRKYILVQLPEKIDEKEPAYKAGYRFIPEIAKDRIRKAGETISGTDIGFKVFKSSDTNIKWNSLITNGQLDLTQIETSPDLVDFMPGSKDEDIVYELILRQRDVPLSERLERLSDIGERVFLYADSYLVCLENEITKEMVEKLAGLDPVPVKYIFRDTAFGDDIALKDETFRRLKAVIGKNAGDTKVTYTVEFI